MTTPPLTPQQQITLKFVGGLGQLPETNPYAEAAKLIHERVHQSGGTAHCVGVGKAATMGELVADLWASTGTATAKMKPMTAGHGDLGRVRAGDVVVAFSNSGKTREIELFLGLLNNKFGEGVVPVICVTGNPTSPLGSASQVVLSTGNPPEALAALPKVPSTSLVNMLVIGQIVQGHLVALSNFGEDAYAKNHAHGAIGDALRQGIFGTESTG